MTVLIRQRWCSLCFQFKFFQEEKSRLSVTFKKRMKEDNVIIWTKKAVLSQLSLATVMNDDPKIFI